MSQLRRDLLEGLAVVLMPVLMLGFFFAVLRDALGTVPVLIDALATVGLGAKVFLALAVGLALGVPPLIAAVSSERSVDLDRLVPPRPRRELP
jgi:hypothetical protein